MEALAFKSQISRLADRGEGTLSACESTPEGQEACLERREGC